MCTWANVRNSIVLVGVDKDEARILVPGRLHGQLLKEMR